MDNLIKALIIIKKYDLKPDNKWPTSCNHAHMSDIYFNGKEIK